MAATRILLGAACLALSLAATVRAAEADRDCVERKARDAESSPYVLSHGHRTPYSIVLIHGLSDSPYYTRALGQVFYDHGWNVVGILLSGHGTTPGDLVHVRLGDWEDDAACGYRAAAELGHRVAIGGFSTGGALAIEAALPPGRFPLAGLFLFSPALDFHDWRANTSCLLRHVLTYDGDHAEDSAVRYRKIALNAVCQLKDLMDKIGHADRASEIVLPTFVAYSAADLTVDPDSIARFARGLKPPHVAIEYPADDGVAHSDVVRPGTNPHFPALVRAMSGFIDDNFLVGR